MSRTSLGVHGSNDWELGHRQAIEHWKSSFQTQLLSPTKTAKRFYLVFHHSSLEAYEIYQCCSWKEQRGLIDVNSWQRLCANWTCYGLLSRTCVHKTLCLYKRSTEVGCRKTNYANNLNLLRAWSRWRKDKLWRITLGSASIDTGRPDLSVDLFLQRTGSLCQHRCAPGWYLLHDDVFS